MARFGAYRCAQHKRHSLDMIALRLPLPATAAPGEFKATQPGPPRESHTSILTSTSQHLMGRKAQFGSSDFENIMKNNNFQICVKSIVQAGRELGFEVISPFCGTTVDGRTFTVLAMCPELGSPRGMIIDIGIGHYLDGNPLAAHFSRENAMYYSVVNPVILSTPNRKAILEAVDDWGAFKSIQSGPR